ncbi:MAG: molecular chaperone DnaJ [Citrobacter freundii]|nr:MAG: molecular chaperone DnaJ [Citrobacter freundii]
MTFFNDCTTIEEVKAKYKQLAKQHHPDMGGNTETMQAINREYAFASARITKGAGLSDQETEDQLRFSEEYRRVIEAIIHLPGIIIELVGAWVWVTGNTYSVKAELKAAGLFFAAKKQAWYYRSEAYKTRGTGKSLDEIKSKYGSERINGKRFRKEINS